MSLFKEIGPLFYKELLLELRQKYAISGILLYVLSTVFIVYLSFVQVEPKVWNTLFWIIVLFASVMPSPRVLYKKMGVGNSIIIVWPIQVLFYYLKSFTTSCFTLVDWAILFGFRSGSR